MRLVLGDSSKDRRLARELLEIQQMIMALLKYKDIMTSVPTRKASDIDSYIANIIMISNKYSWQAYWYYHNYFWDKAAEFLEQGVVVDWSVLDSESLHAAIAKNSHINCCTQCQSWYHPSNKCPFHLRDTEAHQSQPEMVRNFSGEYGNTANRGRAYYKGKEICNRFSYSVCNISWCPYLHMCKFCNKFDHSVKRSPDAPQSK